MSQHQTNQSAHEAKRASRPRRQEQGYALLSILAAMTIATVIMAASIPSLKHEAQREREEEMFWRGAQIAQAITQYQKTHNQQLPTKLEDLAEPFDNGGKRRRLLRPSALHDPMTPPKGEWVPVRVGDPLIAELYSAYMLTVKQPPPQGSMLARFATAQGGTIVGGGLQNTSPSLLSQVMQSNKFNSDTGPIVGVVSASKDSLIRNYYGLETYDHSAFIDGTRMPGVMVNYPVGGGGGAGQQAVATPDPNTGKCPTGKLCIDPNCPPQAQRDGKCVPFQQNRK